MKKRVLAILIAGVLGASLLAGCGGGKDTKKEETKTETSAKTEEKAEEAEEAGETEETAADESNDMNVTFVDGFYASNGSEDFIIAFFTSDAGEIAYINDGTNEVCAEYEITEAALDEGTAYLLVTVGQTQLGYYEDGENVYLVDDEGNVYAAAHLSEEEADTLAQIANS